MRETKFIEQNKKKWEKFEKLSKSSQNDPDEISGLFVEITDDLSYSRTFYPSRSVSLYLNQLSQRIFSDIYKKRGFRRNRLFTFWTEELPLILYDCRKELFISFLVFFSSFLIGMFSSIFDPEFARVILGDTYVDMTIKNIEKGDPMAVYKEMGEFDMLTGITLNNLWVSLQTFLLGIAAGIGTVGYLIVNGVMIGSFQYFFIERGLFWESFLTVWLHGTLEISAIILAGTGGIVMGKGLIFPGTYSRAQSFIMSSQKGLKIFLGTVPIFIVAAIIESLLTRHTGVADALRLILILASLTFVLGYFVYYPRKLGRDKNRKLKMARLMPSPKAKIELNGVPNNGTVYSYSFLIYKNNFLQFLLYSMLASLLFTIFINLLYKAEFLDNILLPFFMTDQGIDFDNFFTSIFGFLANLANIFNYSGNIWVYPVFIVLFTPFLVLIASKIRKALNKNLTVNANLPQNPLPKINIGTVITAFISCSLFFLLFFLPTWLVLMSIIFIFPAFAVFLVISILNGKGPGNALSGISKHLSSVTIGRAFGFSLILALTFCTFFFIVNSPIVFIYFFFIDLLATFPDEVYKTLVYSLILFMALTGVFLSVPLFIFGFSLQYLNSLEINNAGNLMDKLTEMDQRS